MVIGWRRRANVILVFLQIYVLIDIYRLFSKKH